MTGNEFIKRIKKLAKAKGLEVSIEKSRGKGSHITLYYGQKFTVVRNLISHCTMVKNLR